MFPKTLALILGIALGTGSAHAASPMTFPQAEPIFDEEVILVGHRHARGHHIHGYQPGYIPSHPRYRARDQYRPRYGYRPGYFFGHPGRYHQYGQGNAYPRGDGYDPWQNYLRDMYGK